MLIQPFSGSLSLPRKVVGYRPFPDLKNSQNPMSPGRPYKLW
jgi:hypothetical protein